MDTTGKTVTLEKGVVVTDRGPHPDEPLLRVCERDDGDTELIIARVIAELPVTYRRADL